MLTKRQIRKTVLAARRRMRREEIIRESELIAGSLLAWEPYCRARTVMLFISMPDEVRTDAILADALQRGKTVGVPYIRPEPGLMDAVRVRSTADLVEGKYGILTPAASRREIIRPETIDLVIVPAVAFDPAGNRCGMGAGYYDRFLPLTGNAVLAGIALACQLIPVVPRGEYDYRVHYILTNSGVINCLANNRDDR